MHDGGYAEYIVSLFSSLSLLVYLSILHLRWSRPPRRPSCRRRTQGGRGGAADVRRCHRVQLPPPPRRHAWYHYHCHSRRSLFMTPSLLQYERRSLSNRRPCGCSGPRWTGSFGRPVRSQGSYPVPVLYSRTCHCPCLILVIRWDSLLRRSLPAVTKKNSPRNLAWTYTSTARSRMWSRNSRSMAAPGTTDSPLSQVPISHPLSPTIALTLYVG